MVMMKVSRFWFGAAVLIMVFFLATVAMASGGTGMRAP